MANILHEFPESMYKYPLVMLASRATHKNIIALMINDLYMQWNQMLVRYCTTQNSVQMIILDVMLMLDSKSEVSPD